MEENRAERRRQEKEAAKKVKACT
ncbi:hypothetical protein LCGC14_2910300, partial [marine sediment metagenome]